MAEYCHPAGSFSLQFDHISLFSIGFGFATFLCPYDPQDPVFFTCRISWFFDDFSAVQALHRFYGPSSSFHPRD
jgi:hypothetical protein